MTRFLANENFAGASVAMLRSRGLDVAWVREEAPSSDDRAIMAWATRSNRVILTFDHDYGDLVFRHGLAAPGVVFFRLPDLADLQEPARLVLNLLSRPGFVFEGMFVVVSRRGTRVVPMPARTDRGGRA
jgi:predicted nuclease of predicted toxin-antitoxin system